MSIKRRERKMMQRRYSKNIVNCDNASYYRMLFVAKIDGYWCNDDYVSRE